MRIKIITAAKLDDLEQSVNDFLDGYNADQIVSVEYMNDTDLTCWAVMVTYKA